jgi:RNA-directed DNA polymerase
MSGDVHVRFCESAGVRFPRATHRNIYVRSQRAGQRTMVSITNFIIRKLKLKVNSEKSAVDRPSKRKFLGFSFTQGPKPKRRVSPITVKRFKERVRKLTRRTRGVSQEKMVGQLRLYLRGWHGYFGFCQTPSVLRNLEQWTRRRLRCVLWMQWKRGRTRFDELRKRGVSKSLAAQTAGSAHGPWRISRSPALNIALPNSLFDSMGLPRLTATL